MIDGGLAAFYWSALLYGVIGFPYGLAKRKKPMGAFHGVLGASMLVLGGVGLSIS